MLTLAEGRASAGVRVIFRLRLVVLLLLAAALFMVMPHSLLHWQNAGLLVAGPATLFLALLLSYLHFRHIGLSLLIVLAPLCGSIFAIAAGPLLRTEFELLGYLSGLSAGIFIADALMGTLATGLHRSEAARAAFAAYIPALLTTMLFAVAPGIGFILRDQAFLPAAGATLLLAAPVAAALLIVPLAGSYFRYGQNYLELASRIQERRQCRAEALAVLTEPRWALSLTGIVIVFTVLFWFGAGTVDLSSNWQIGTAVLGLLVVSATLATMRWRAAIGVMVCVLICAAAAMAMAGRLALPFWAVFDIVSAMSVIVFLVCALVAWRFCLGERDGDEPDAARMRSVARLAPPMLLSALAVILICPFWYGQINLLVLLSGLVAGHVAALFAVAAITGALETLIPRRRSLESLYRG